ncbi:hypothetical protein [Hyalangium rubrum]|uniref:Uncharacterized protein n=1 Tax=Hyalangium rubrum TaxID=3103134 RepID=A0ABU5HE29_9BACT|nr:hypothetical protein [Hyalangium sp. s54d21]MDY7231119.1 hypothetical protein [Hyalangium sp. s54d21]
MLVFSGSLSCILGALGVGCASTASAPRADASRDIAAQQHQSREAFRDAAQQLLDERVTLREAAEQYLEDSAAQRGSRLSVIQVAGKDPVIPRFECMEYGCPDKVLCGDAKAVCLVTHCGKGSCNLCPEPMPDAFKNLVFKQWCEYECVRGAARLGTVIGFVPSFGSGFVGPFGCPKE